MEATDREGLSRRWLFIWLISDMVRCDSNASGSTIHREKGVFYLYYF